MWKLKIHKRTKYLLVAVATLFVIGLSYRFMPVFNGILFPGEEIDSKEKQLAKILGIVEAGRDLDKRVAYLEQILKQSESGLLNGKTPSLAAADIQSILHEIAKKSNVEIQRVKVLKPVQLDQKDYLGIPVEFSIVPDIRQLKEILYRIESSSKYLDVKNLRVKHMGIKSRKLACLITVSGFMKKVET